MLLSLSFSESRKPIWNVRPFLRPRRARTRSIKPMSRRRPMMPPATIPATAPLDSLYEHQLQSARDIWCKLTLTQILLLHCKRPSDRDWPEIKDNVPSAQRWCRIHLSIIDRKGVVFVSAVFNAKSHFVGSSSQPRSMIKHGLGVERRIASAQIFWKSIRIREHSV